MLTSFLTTLYHVFLPISLPVIAGGLLKRLRGMETKSLSAISLYITSPALIFEALVQASVTGGEITATITFSVINMLILWMLCILAGRWLKLSTPEKSGLALTALFTNSVNYGLPLVLLALGQAGLDKASVYVIVQSIIINTFGVYLAARSHFSATQAVLSVFKLPAVYAAVLAVIIRMTGTAIPEPLDTGIGMLSAAYAPLALMILGAQMMGVKDGGGAVITRRGFWAGMTMRMAAAPLVAWGVLTLLSIEGVLFDVMLILSSMPAAVNAVILAEQYDAAPRLVSMCILWTTLASFVFLPLLIGIL